MYLGWLFFGNDILVFGLMGVWVVGYVLKRYKRVL